MGSSRAPGVHDGADAPTVKADAPTVNQEGLDRAMRSLRVCVRALSAVMLALLARVVIDGPSPAVVLTGALVALLLLVSGMLWQYGRRLEAQGETSRNGAADRREDRNGAADR
jgi:hypothetical protein